MTELCEDNSIVVMNNEPLAKGIRNKHPVLLGLANELEIPVEQVCAIFMRIVLQLS